MDTSTAQSIISSPFRDCTLEKINYAVDQCVKDFNLEERHDIQNDLRRGALLSRGNEFRRRTQGEEMPMSTENAVVGVNAEEEKSLEVEKSTLNSRGFLRKLRGCSSTTMWIIVNCSIGALIQGFDETAVNGAQVFYRETFPELKTEPYLGLVNAAPYLVAAFACLFNPALNRLLRGRRGVICATCFISSATCLGQAFPSTWKALLAARLLMGLGIGPKSATIPVYASECMPAQVRGALVMMWQMWTAFGIMLGFLFGWIFRNIGWDLCQDWEKEISYVGLPCSWNWRLMLAIPMLPALIPMMFIFSLPESPRFLLQQAIEAVRAAETTNSPEKKAKSREYFDRADKALSKIYKTSLQARRELLCIYINLRGPKDHKEKGFRGPIWFPDVKAMWSQPRTRHALVASSITMFLQQFCGINVLVYYSTSVLGSQMASGSEVPFFVSLGFGACNFFFAWPTFFLMDRLGRRYLLLLTFPFMSVFLIILAGLLSGKSDNEPLPNAYLGGVVVSTYMFCIAYSLGEGPVPFVYSSESMPTHHRDSGMGIVTFITWIFNFVLAITWPSFERALTMAGAFGFYAAWCFVGFFLVLFFVRETKIQELEDLDDTFEPGFMEYIKHVTKEQIPYAMNFYQKYNKKKRPNWNEKARELVSEQIAIMPEEDTR